jgi:protein-disulfide isomerase/uncharacterized membrane protein
MNKLPLVLLIVLSVIGMGLATYLTTTHFQILEAEAAANSLEALKDLKSSSVCDVGGNTSCVDVSRSKWAKISVGEGRPALPLSALVIGFYITTALLSLLALLGNEERRKAALSLVAALATIALLDGLFLIYIQAVEIKSWCLFCLGIDAANIGLLVLAVVAHGGGIGDTLSAAKRTPVPLALIAAVALLAGTGVAYKTYTAELDKAGLTERTASQSGKTETGSTAGKTGHDSHDGHNHDGHNHGEEPKAFEDLTEEEKQKAIAESRAALVQFLEDFKTVEPKSIPLASFDATKGNATAKVTFIEFADFECPHCRQLGWYMQDIAQRYYELVHFVFKHYPLGKACNDMMSRDMHPEACQAAVATQCARRQGAFWPFHDQTFDSQGSLSKKKLEKIADGLKLDRSAFDACLTSDAAWDEVRAQVAAGRALGLQGTPAVYVNGKELPSLHPLAIETALRQELLNQGVDAASLPANEHGFLPN